MKKYAILSLIIMSGMILFCGNLRGQEATLISLARMPLHNIGKEYPVKPGHVYNSPDELGMSNRDFHPVFYGSFDWHSSVHGHWMLVRLLKKYPQLPVADSIRTLFDTSFVKEKMETEALYFTKYKSPSFERTYGWAWLLKLDQELREWNDPAAGRWRAALSPLTAEIVRIWKAYLPKQTYPDRTGMHPNSAFALGFAIDWARTAGDLEFEKTLTAKAFEFYGKERNTPAYLEPNGTDFFSPSLLIADLMSRIMKPADFSVWFSRFIDAKGLRNVSTPPVVSDLNDYMIVHLVGLSFSRAWCMKSIASALPAKDPRRATLLKTAEMLTQKAFPLLFGSNYGGDHWLASFAIYATE